MKTLPLLVVALLGIWLLAEGLPAAQAQDAGNEPTYSWTYHYKKGDVLRLRGRLDIFAELPHEVNGKLVNGPVKVVIRSVIKQDVQSAAGNGDAVLQDTSELYETLIEGMAPAADTLPKKVRTVSKTGQVLKQVIKSDRNEPKDQLEALGILLNEMIVPDRPVKIGESWKSELNNRFIEGKKVTLTSTLIGPETQLGVEALKVEVRMSVPTKLDASEQETIKLTGSYYFAPKAGRKLQAAFELENVPLPTPAGKQYVKVSYRMEQILAGVNDKESPVEPDKPAH